jgi:hypothetical protein
MLGYHTHRRRNALNMGLDYLAFGLFGQFFSAILILLLCEGWAQPVTAVGMMSMIISTGVLVGGCAKFAKFHGLPSACGLLGMLSILGVLALVLIPPLLRGRPASEGFSVIFAEPYRRDVWRMEVRVKLNESIGAGVTEPIILQLPRGANIGTALKILAGVIPNLMDHELPDACFAVNGAVADRRGELSDGDEVIISRQPVVCR